jgi:hypothetical protein
MEAFRQLCTAAKLPQGLTGGVRGELWSHFRSVDKPSGFAQILDGLLSSLEEEVRLGADSYYLDGICKTLSLGWIYHPEKKNTDKALKYARMAVEESGTLDPRALRILAEVHALSGDVCEAVLCLEKAARLPGPTAGLKRELAEYREKQLPSYCSYTSIDAAIAWARVEVLIREGADWRYFPGKKEPPKDWNLPDFDHSSWQEGPSGFRNVSTILRQPSSEFTVEVLRYR